MDASHWRLHLGKAEDILCSTPNTAPNLHLLNLITATGFALLILNQLGEWQSMVTSAVFHPALFVGIAIATSSSQPLVS